MRLLLLILAAVAVTTLGLPTPNKDDKSWADLDRIFQSESNLKNKSVSSGRSDSSLQNDIDRYMKSIDASFQFPLIGSTITVNGRNLDNNELDFKIDLNDGSETEARKKSKIKKIFIPILVFILLKAIVLIPLALGILGIKTWNAIQLSFISFVSAAVLAIWKLCSKLNHHHAPAIIHSDWDPHHHDRSDPAQQIMYSGYNLQ